MYTDIYLCFKLCILMPDDSYDMIYSFTAVGLTPEGSSTYLYTNSTQNNKMKHST